jgi:hypothetical protein
MQPNPTLQKLWSHPFTMGPLVSPVAQGEEGPGNTGNSGPLAPGGAGALCGSPHGSSSGSPRFKPFYLLSHFISTAPIDGTKES